MITTYTHTNRGNTMINHYNSLTVCELETIAYQTNNTLALAIVSKYDELENELGEEIDSLKAELRELKTAPVLEKINQFCLAVVEYHNSEDHLENYFYDSSSIIDLVTYENTFKGRLEDAWRDEWSKDEYEHILELIASGMIATNIKKTHMAAYPSPGFIEVCGAVMGEVEEQLPNNLVKLIEENGITEDEINGHISEGYCSDGSIYFDYTYDVVFIEASIQDIESLLEEYRCK